MSNSNNRMEGLAPPPIEYREVHKALLYHHDCINVYAVRTVSYEHLEIQATDQVLKLKTIHSEQLDDFNDSGQENSADDEAGDNA